MTPQMTLEICCVSVRLNADRLSWVYSLHVRTWSSNVDMPLADIID